MARLEYSPIFDWTQFNFLGKRLYDFINARVSISTNNYVGDGVGNRFIQTDLNPRIIIIFSADEELPVIWIDQFISPNSKTFDGTNIVDGIIGLSDRRQGFILGGNILVNAAGVQYYYIVIGE